MNKIDKSPLSWEAYILAGHDREQAVDIINDEWVN